MVWQIPEKDKIQTAQSFQPTIGSSWQIPKGDEIESTPEQKESLDNLFIGQLGGQLPLSLTPKEAKIKESWPLWGFHGQQLIKEEQDRENAYTNLLKRGYDKEQLETVLRVQKGASPRIGRTAGGILGPMAAPVIAHAIGKIGPLAALPEETITTPLVAAGLAYLGGAGGEAAQIGIEEKRKATISEMHKAGKTESLYELGGRYGMLGAKYTVFSPFIKKTNPEAAYIMKKYGENALTFSPAELDKRLAISAAESISRGSFATNKLWEDFAEKGLNGIRGVADQLTDTMIEGATRLPPNEAVKVFTEGLLPGGFIMTQVDELFDPLFKQFSKMVPNAKHSTAGLKAFAQRQIAIDKAMMKKGVEKGTYLTPQGRKLFETIVDYKDIFTTDQMRLARSDYIKTSRTFARETDRNESLVKELVGIADDAIFNPTFPSGKEFRKIGGEIAYQGMTPEAQRFLRNTNALYDNVYGSGKTATKVGGAPMIKGVLQEEFSERMAKQLAKNPAKYSSALFPAKNPDAIIRLREALTKPIAGQPNREGRLLWNQLRANWYNDLLDKVSKEEGLSKTAYYNAIKNMGDSLKEIIPEEKIRIGITEDIPKMLDLKRISTAAGTPLFSKGLQVGGAVKVYQGITKGNILAVTTGGLLAVGPDAFAKLATEPTGRGLKLLTAGFNVSRGKTSQAGPVILRMVNLLNEIDKYEQRELVQAERRRKQARFMDGSPSMKQLSGFGGRGY